MRKITIICAFALICVFMTGSYFLHKVYLSNYKKEFKAHLLKATDLSNCRSIIINPCELYLNTSVLSWEDDNHELIYEGKLYDVLKVETHGTKVFITLIPDENEEVLKREFAGLYNDQAGQAKKDPFNLLKYFFALEFVFPTDKTVFPDFTISHLRYYNILTFRLTNRYSSQQVPPP